MNSAESKKAASGILQIAFTIYFFGFLLSAPYFNWKYASENGFWKWVCLGEIVATAKAVIWPYYAIKSISSGGSKTAKTDVRDAQANCQNTHIEASAGSEILSRYRTIANTPEDLRKTAAGHFQRAATYASNVDSMWLAKFHADMPKQWKEYASSLSTVAEAIPQGDESKMRFGMLGILRFGEWGESVKPK